MTYHLNGHAYALLASLDRHERNGASPVRRYQLEESQRADELIDAGLVEERDYPNVALTDAGRQEVKQGHPGWDGREVNAR